jgi:hypothetical protein
VDLDDRPGKSNRPVVPWSELQGRGCVAHSVYAHLSHSQAMRTRRRSVRHTNAGRGAAPPPAVVHADRAPKLCLCAAIDFEPTLGAPLAAKRRHVETIA